jgi:hypothetical protein
MSVVKASKKLSPNTLTLRNPLFVGSIKYRIRSRSLGTSKVSVRPTLAPLKVTICVGLAQPSLGPGPGNADACTGTTVCSPVVVPVVPVVVPVVPVVLVPVVVPVVLVPLVACPHAGNANTKRRVRAANIVLKYGTDFSLLVIYHNNSPTIAYLCKQCNELGKRDVAASHASAKRIRTSTIPLLPLA